MKEVFKVEVLNVVDEKPTIKVFYSYARIDKSLSIELEKHLGNLRRQGYITSWFDQNINAGDEWEKKISTNLEEADIILLLISPDFMSSDYCYSVELKKALEKHQHQQAKIIPVILRPTDWENDLLSKLQALPTNAKPITTWTNLDEAFFDVTKNLRKVVLEMISDKYLKKAEEVSNELDMLSYLYSNDELLYDYEKLIEICEKSIKVNENQYEAYIKKAGALYELKRFDEALVAYEKALELNPNSESYSFKKAEALYELNRFDEALVAYEKVLELNPNSERYHNSKGLCLYCLDRFMEAVKSYDIAITLNKDWYGYYLNKANALIHLGLNTEAQLAHEIAVRLCPDKDECYIKYGRTLYYSGRNEEALTLYEKAISLNPQNAFYFIDKGDALLAIQRYEEAFAAYQKAIDLDPTKPSFYRAKAHLLKELSTVALRKADELEKPKER